MGPTFNDAEILPWVIEEHVTCWYHHWTLGGSRGTHWLQNLVPQTITEVDPGTNQTLGPTFNDAEILPWVIEEHVVPSPVGTITGPYGAAGGHIGYEI